MRAHTKRSILGVLVVVLVLHTAVTPRLLRYRDSATTAGTIAIDEHVVSPRRELRHTYAHIVGVIGA